MTPALNWQGLYYLDNEIYLGILIGNLERYTRLKTKLMPPTLNKQGRFIQFGSVNGFL